MDHSFRLIVEIFYLIRIWLGIIVSKNSSLKWLRGRDTVPTLGLVTILVVSGQICMLSGPPILCSRKLFKLVCYAIGFT